MRCRAYPVLLAAGLTLAGCGSPERPPGDGEPPARETAAAAAGASPAVAGAGSEAPSARAAESADPLAGIVWQRADGGGPPGELRIFLADGSLVETSCVEVYALRTWRRTSPEEIVLVEDVEIPARIVALSAEELRLSLALVGGTHEEVAYRRARPPFVCPEMHR